MKLKDKIALVTGAGRGLGKGIARAFANEGAKLAINESEEKNAADTVQMIKTNGGEARLRDGRSWHARSRQAMPIVGFVEGRSDSASLSRASQTLPTPQPEWARRDCKPGRPERRTASALP